MTQPPVLIAEGLADVAALLRNHIENEGHTTRVVCTARDVLHALARERACLIMLDTALPDRNGLELCRTLKSEPGTRDIPIVMLSPKGDESEIVAALEIGADDYITKPFSPRVMVARVKAVLRRHGAEHAGRIAVVQEDVVIDSARHAVIVEGKELDLTPTQFQLLRYLAARPGFVRSRDQIVAAVRGPQTVLSRRAVDVHVAALRQKLGSYSVIIETVRGVGYRLADPATLAVAGV